MILIWNHFSATDLWFWFEITFWVILILNWQIICKSVTDSHCASYRRRTAYIHNDKRRLLTCPDFCGKFYQWALGTLFSFVYSLLTDGDVMADKNVNDVGEVKIKETIPSILDGKFFKITKTDEAGKVLAKCCNCVNKTISGTLNTTSNFLRHLKVCLLTTN